MTLESRLMPLFIMRTCEQRKDAFKSYVADIPCLINCYDDFDKTVFQNTSMLNMKKALSIAINEKSAAVILEDDIILCADFMKKALKEIEQKPNDLIQFFSMRQDDLTVGSRYITGSKYLMNQCFYAPLSILTLIYQTFDEFEEVRQDNRIGGTDSLIAYTLKKHKLRYWNVVPNLVDHKASVSAIDKRRSSARQSFTFEK